MPYGLTNAGFSAKTIQEIQADIVASQRADIDAALDVSDSEPIGIQNGIVAASQAEIWELLSTAFSALNPNNAENWMLDFICSLTGTFRKGATKSYVDVNVTVSANCSFGAQALQIAVTSQPSIRFRNVSGFSETLAGVYLVRFEAEQTGPVVAYSGTLTTILAPVLNVISVTNPLDATEGSEIESDAALRLRRISELSQNGGATPDSTYTDLIDVPGVQQAFVFENTTMITDANGLPPKSFESLIYDGFPSAANNSEISQAVWDNKHSGIQTYGDIMGTAIDSTGTERIVYWSRATQQGFSVSIYLEVTKDFPVNGIALVTAAIDAAAQTTQSLGKDIVQETYRSAAFAACPGINAILGYGQYNFAAPPAPVFDFTDSGKIVVPPRKKAALDSANITVTIILTSST